MEKEDLDQIFTQYFNSPATAQIAAVILANNEMTLDVLVKCVGGFKTTQKRKEFQTKTFNYVDHILLEVEERHSEENGEKQVHKIHKFIQQYQEQVSQKLKELDLQIMTPSLKLLINTGIQENYNNILFEKKKSNFESKQMMQEPPSKSEYMKKLITTIIEKSSRQVDDEEVINRIIKYGGVQIAYANPLFSGDQNFRNKFNTILNNCKTFIQLKKYSGQDITSMKQKLLDSISICLINLRFDQTVSQQICEELLKNPLSHIVALHPQLTNKEKESYYKSDFYESGFLKSFALLTQYEKCLEHQVKNDVSKILTAIEEHIRVTNEILQHVLSFNLFQLLKVDTMRNIKKNIYDRIIKECPHYFTAFKMIKYQKKNLSDLSLNETINQKINLAKIFFTIKLPFEEWKIAEDKILSRDYKVVDDLTLKLSAKSKLVQHIFSTVETYLHLKDKEMNYRSQMELVLLKEIMTTDISDQKFEKILNIISQTLDQENFISNDALQLAPADKRAYNEVLKNQQFLKYKQNKRKDVTEENYAKGLELKKKIYENNFESGVSVSFESIEKFVESVIEKGGKIPSTYPQYITDLSKLNPQISKVVEVIVQIKELTNLGPAEMETNSPGKSANGQQQLLPQQKPIVVEQQDKESLTKRLTSICTELAHTYIEKDDQCYFKRYLSSKFGDNPVEYIKKLIETNAFGNPDSSFFTSLEQKIFIVNKVKREFSNNAAFVIPILNQCSLILDKLKGCQPSKPALEEKLSVEAQAFIEEYNKKYEDNKLHKIMVEKYESNPSKMIKAIIEFKAFQNSQSAFFENLGYPKHRLNPIRTEFDQNGKQSVQSLKRCREIISQLA